LNSNLLFWEPLTDLRPTGPRGGECPGGMGIPITWPYKALSSICHPTAFELIVGKPEAIHMAEKSISDFGPGPGAPEL
jgi:hypothetical protein